MKEIKKALMLLPYEEACLQMIAKALEPAELIPCSAGDTAGLNRRLPEVDIALVACPPSNQAIRNAIHLRWLHCDWVGLESVYTPEVARRENLIVTNASGRSSAALAEHALLFIIALSHRLPQWYEAQQAREWLPSLPPGAATLRGKTVGVLGTGSIGTEVAKLCNGLSMITMGYQRSGKNPNPNFKIIVSERDGLEKLLTTSDFVVLALPLTNETRGFLGAKELALMKPSAFLTRFIHTPLNNNKREAPEEATK